MKDTFKCPSKSDVRLIDSQLKGVYLIEMPVTRELPEVTQTQKNH